ncbi:MAG: hypothetical protein ABR608_12570 [Pseudonocardiaceae bacterium]
MSQRSGWQELRSRRMAEPGAADAYDAARLAFELAAGPVLVGGLSEPSGYCALDGQPRGGLGLTSQHWPTLHPAPPGPREDYSLC